MIPSFIITTFIIFNAIPDFIFNFHYNDATYHVTACLWTIGIVTDPIIYIFLNKKSRRIAKGIAKEDQNTFSVIARTIQISSINEMV